MIDKIARQPSSPRAGLRPSAGRQCVASSDNTYLGMACLTTATYCPDLPLPAVGASHGNPMLQALTGKNVLPDLRAQAPSIASW